MSETEIPLTISRTSDGLVVAGEVDASTVATLLSFLMPLPGTSGEVSIDMKQVSFIDSSGLRVLIEAQQRAEQCQRSVVITNPSSIVARMLDLSGLSSMFNVAQQH